MTPAARKPTMTPEQLNALMDWARNMAAYEIEMQASADMDGSYKKAETISRRTLYDAFGFDTGPFDEPRQRQESKPECPPSASPRKPITLSTSRS